jgi:hypothetical protein
MINMTDKEVDQVKMPEGVTEISAEPEMEVPSEMVQSGAMQPTKTVFDDQVVGDDGEPLISTPETKEITIEVPKTQAELEEMSKGSPDDSSTWFAVSWIRRIKQAFNEKIKVVLGVNKNKLT